uniref:F-box/kelch-repeat protein At3g23880 family n=2 Tax=Cajanus cajan TaxID=3821 RepID=A0A151S5Z9_CAJCA|nr:F-box/kelch-repeat protein At3g23880 family [Cajanus cajan]
MLFYVPELPQELILEILSWLPVKDLMRFRCLSKTWTTLMSHHAFVKLHLQRSSKNKHVLLSFYQHDNAVGNRNNSSVAAAPCSTDGLLENPTSTINNCIRRFSETSIVIGTCNGLVCICSYFKTDDYIKYWVRFWNPATRIMSEDSPYIVLFDSDYQNELYYLKFGFGFDDLSGNYKVVMILLDVQSYKRETRVLTWGISVWKKTLNCPLFPLPDPVVGQLVSGTLNWLALSSVGNGPDGYDWDIVTVDDLVIFSYDLKNDTYRYLLMPHGLLEVPAREPYLGVLKGCLCLSLDYKDTHFVVWLMREFGIQKSWTQILNVSYEYHHYPIHAFALNFMPLFMSENEDILLLADEVRSLYVVYNLRDTRIDHTHGFNVHSHFYVSYDYVQSLTLPY